MADFSIMVQSLVEINGKKLLRDLKEAWVENFQTLCAFWITSLFCLHNTKTALTVTKLEPHREI